MKHKKRNQYKIECQKLVNIAIKEGKIKRPSICHMCFIKCKPNAHHPDYNKPFLVQWLCGLCHKIVHWNKRKTKKWLKISKHIPILNKIRAKDGLPLIKPPRLKTINPYLGAKNGV